MRSCIAVHACSAWLAAPSHRTASSRVVPRAASGGTRGWSPRSSGWQLAEASAAARCAASAASRASSASARRAAICAGAASRVVCSAWPRRACSASLRPGGRHRRRAATTPPLARDGRLFPPQVAAPAPQLAPTGEVRRGRAQRLRHQPRGLRRAARPGGAFGRRRFVCRQRREQLLVEPSLDIRTHEGVFSPTRGRASSPSRWRRCSSTRSGCSCSSIGWAGASWSPRQWRSCSSHPSTSSATSSGASGARSDPAGRGPRRCRDRFACCGGACCGPQSTPRRSASGRSPP